MRSYITFVIRAGYTLNGQLCLYRGSGHDPRNLWVGHIAFSFSPNWSIHLVWIISGSKEMIQDRCRRRENDLLRLPRQTLRLVIGVLTGHAWLNRHLSIMGLVKDPLCNQCDMAIESASHFLCQCDRYITLRQKVWGKPYLDPADIDHATVRGLERFIKKSHRFTQTL